jgi:hypothetical protein
MTIGRKISFALVVCWIATASLSSNLCATEPEQVTVGDLIAQGREALNTGKLDEAISAFDSAIALDPANRGRFLQSRRRS